MSRDSGLTAAPKPRPVSVSGWRVPSPGTPSHGSLLLSPGEQASLFTSCLGTAGSGRDLCAWVLPPSLSRPGVGRGQGEGAVAHLDADAVGSEVLAQGVARLQQGLPVQQLPPPRLPGSRPAGQRELPDLEPEADQLLQHAVQSRLAAVPARDLRRGSGRASGGVRPPWAGPRPARLAHPAEPPVTAHVLGRAWSRSGRVWGRECTDLLLTRVGKSTPHRLTKPHLFPLTKHSKLVIT